jgi:glycosyltransferase involved in cell wall biosynthesis
MKRILHLSHTDIRSDSRILKEMKSASDSGFKVSGIGLASKEKSIDVLSETSIISLEVFFRQVKFIPRGVRGVLIYLEVSFRILIEVIKCYPTIIHCNDFLMLPISVLGKLFTGAKIVYDAHELESDRNGLSANKGKVILFAEKILWCFVDGLIVVSPSIARWYSDNVGAKKTTIVLNSPVLNKNIPSDSDYLRDKYNIPKEAKIFIYVGLLMRGRGIELVLDAFKHNDMSHVVFLGYGELSDSLNTLSREVINVHVHEAVAHHDVVSVVQSADVGLCLIQNVSLSDYYCLPNKLFEYIFSGIPVLASNFPDISDLVKRCGVGVCVDLDVTSISDGICQFENDEVDFIADDAQLEEFSWSRQEKELMKLYHSVI